MNVNLLRTACRTDCFLYNIHNLSGVWRFHGDQCFYHTNVHNPNQFESPANFVSLAWLPCTSLFCPTLSVLERVVLPAVQGKFTSNLYVTCSTEPCTAGCTTDLYVRGNGPLPGQNMWVLLQTAPDILFICAVTHPSTNRAQRCLTLVIKWEPVCPT
jgi:hypothetical protein